jgi:isopentenyl phosphate kinase
MKKSTLFTILAGLFTVIILFGLIVYESSRNRADRVHRTTYLIGQTITAMTADPEHTPISFRDGQLRDNFKRVLSSYINHQVVPKSYDDDILVYEILSGDFLIGYLVVSVESHNRPTIIDFMRIVINRAKVATSTSRPSHQN